MKEDQSVAICIQRKDRDDKRNFSDAFFTFYVFCVPVFIIVLLGGRHKLSCCVLKVVGR